LVALGNEFDLLFKESFLFIELRISLHLPSGHFFMSLLLLLKLLLAVFGDAVRVLLERCNFEFLLLLKTFFVFLDQL